MALPWQLLDADVAVVVTEIESLSRRLAGAQLAQALFTVLHAFAAPRPAADGSPDSRAPPPALAQHWLNRNPHPRRSSVVS